MQLTGKHLWSGSSMTSPRRVGGRHSNTYERAEICHTQYSCSTAQHSIPLLPACLPTRQTLCNKASTLIDEGRPPNLSRHLLAALYTYLLSYNKHVCMYFRPSWTIHQSIYHSISPSTYASPATRSLSPIRGAGRRLIVISHRL